MLLEMMSNPPVYRKNPVPARNQACSPHCHLGHSDQNIISLSGAMAANASSTDAPAWCWTYSKGFEGFTV